MSVIQFLEYHSYEGRAAAHLLCYEDVLHIMQLADLLQ